MMGIRIIDASKGSWYEKEIGNVFGVIRETSDTYIVKEGKLLDHFVRKENCEIVEGW